MSWIRFEQLEIPPYYLLNRFGKIFKASPEAFCCSVHLEFFECALLL